MIVKRKYGCIPDQPDIRDFTYSVPPHVARVLPPSVDLSPRCLPIRNQANLGACTGFGGRGAVGFVLRAENTKTAFDPSPLFAYYNARRLEGTTGQDAGAMIRDVIKGVVKFGVVPEADWPYVTWKYATRPPAKCYTHALTHQVIEYRRVSQTLDDLRGCLAEGFPVVIGISVYESFESAFVAKTGKVPMPDARRERLLGGHCMYVVGYDDKTRMFLVANSWGDAWGAKGFCFIPYDYLINLNLSADFWMVRRVEFDVSKKATERRAA